MAEIVKRQKALSVNPLKASQPVGGSLATLGFNRSMPMLHGSQGCTAFAKVYFVRHFREPIPLQTSAMDQASSILGADENVVEGIKNIAEKSKPDLITVLTTGLAETQGADVQRNVKEFRAKYPQFDHVAVVPVNTPDFTGSVESGYALTILEIIRCLVPDFETAGTKPGNRKRQVNILAGAMLTPGDIEALEEIFEQFQLRPLFIPNIAGSLDGSLTEEEFSPVTIGGTLISEMATLGDATATITIGPSLAKASELLAQKTGVPNYDIPHLYGLEANDQLISILAEISGNDVPQRIERQRSQLQDAMLDTHFMLGQLRVAIAGDPDQINAFAHLLNGMGAEVVVAVVPSQTPLLAELPIAEVKIGDLEDLEILGQERKAQLVIGNSHAVATAERLGIPILRTGFPLFDVIGGYQKTWVGYRGSKQTLFDLANLVINFAHEEIPVYHSIYGQKPEHEKQPPVMPPLTRRMRVAHDDNQQEPMDTSIKIAFATSDMKTVNQHFGSAKSFAIYAINPGRVEFIEAAQFGKLDQDGNEDKLAVKFDLLKDCSAVYCQAVGASTVRQLVGLGIQPVKVQENSPIQKLLEDLQSELRSGPSSWLAKAIKQQGGDDTTKFDEMADEDWQE